MPCRAATTGSWRSTSAPSFSSPLTDELRTFLRRTSVLERLTAPVCDAVLKQKDSGRVLASLERRHLLVAPLDRHGEAYRCHPLLRDLLARELGETEPALVATLHRRAADWFEAHGDPESALAHAEGSGDVDRMARIVAAIALPTYYRGRIAEVESWLERFDDEAQLERYPAVAVLGGWIHALGGRPAAAERWLAAAERGAALETAPDDVSVAPAISVLRAALCRDGVEQMCADTESALAGLPPNSQWRPTALLLLGCTLVLRGQDALADAILAAAEESAERLKRPTPSSSPSASARSSRPRAASTRSPSYTRCARGHWPRSTGSTATRRPHSSSPPRRAPRCAAATGTRPARAWRPRTP